MYIHEAIQLTTKNNPFISRRAWCIEQDGKYLPPVKLFPTNTPDRCLIVSEHSSLGPRRGWEPSAEDLSADDWFTCSGRFGAVQSRDKWK